jgi:hypothetical protein
VQGDGEKGCLAGWLAGWLAGCSGVAVLPRTRRAPVIEAPHGVAAPQQLQRPVLQRGGLGVDGEVACEHLRREEVVLQ